jgi:hypothetical protein
VIVMFHEVHQEIEVELNLNLLIYFVDAGEEVGEFGLEPGNQI